MMYHDRMSPSVTPARPTTHETPASILKSVFGYDSFRPLQEEIISGILAGRDTLAVMPTGGGKSLCYQVPALLFPGLTIVVTPLIALMQDQVAALESSGVEALFLNSSLDRDAYRENVARIRGGKVKLLYAAPESLATERVQELLSSVRVDCITIDEAHCISDWGHDFRPEYRQIAGIRDLFPGAVCLALTATATSRVRGDIKKNLKLDHPAEFVASFNRKNIFLEVIPKKNPVHQILAFLEGRGEESGIIYCFSRKQVDDLAVELSSRGHKALPYHAGLADGVRMENQAAFLRDEALIMVATIAFGMGINKPNVRFVIHFDLPKSPEQYYQEIGRAGRDGEPARAILLYNYGDTRKIRFFMEDKSAKDTKRAEEHLKAITAYAEARTCRRKILLAWFGEDYTPPEVADGTRSQNPGESVDFPCCDACSSPARPDVDVTIQAQKFLSCVVRTGERYGAAYVIDVLMGSRQKRIVDNGHHRLSTWGIGKEMDKDDWFELARLLVAGGYLRKEAEYGVLSLTTDARDALSERTEILLPFFLAGGTGSAGATGSSPLAGLDHADTADTPGGPTAARPRSAGRQGTLKFPKKTGTGVDPLDRDGLRRLSALKNLRRGLAEAASVPPYVIFSDRTLEDIVAKNPSAVDDLLGVYGIGAVKAERYGEFIMRALRDED